MLAYIGKMVFFRKMVLIEILDIECALIFFLSENFVSTQAPAEKNFARLRGVYVIVYYKKI